MNQLYNHQKKFEKNYEGKHLLVHEAGTGKTICACLWLKDGKDQNALIICPKRIVKKWEKELEKWGTKGTVMSKENFKKNFHEVMAKSWSSRVIDEADNFASPLFSKKRSQLATCMFEFTKHRQMPTLLLTATPIRSVPANLHTLLCYLGIYIDWKKWQDRFYALESKPFMRGRMAWFPKRGWQKDIQQTLEKYADIVLLKDVVKKIPKEIVEIIKTKPKTKFVKNIDWTEPAKIFVQKHKHEQKDKIKYILEIAKDFRKVIVVAHYVEQVKELQEKLAKDRETFCVYGGVKDQESIIEKANNSNECFLILQASIGEGFDADTFSAMIFASMSYKVRDYIQMKARIKRVHNLHDVYYYFLIGGSCDKGVLDTIKKGRDFVASEYGYTEDQ